MMAVEHKLAQQHEISPPPTGPLPKIPKPTIIFDRLNIGRPSTSSSNKPSKYQLWPKLSKPAATGRRTPDLLDLKRSDSSSDLNSGATSDLRRSPRGDRYENVDSPTIPAFYLTHDRSKSDPSAAIVRSPPPDGPVNKPFPPPGANNNSLGVSVNASAPASGRISPLGINPQNADDSPAREEKEKEDSPPQVPPKNEVIAARKPVPIHDRENNYLNSMKSTLFSRSNTVKRPATAQGRDNISPPRFLQAAPAQREGSVSPARPVRHESSAGGRARANSDERRQNKPWTPPSSNGGDRFKIHSEMPLVKIPNGFSVEQAATSLSDSEITELQHQVRDQSKPFGVLKHNEVVALREELQALEKHCEYLRETYTSLRAGRQRLHVRLITHLKSPHISNFATKGILKQEESLYELDRSIDEWASKLDFAERRCNRVHRKLMEHMVATMLVPERHGDSSTDSSPRLSAQSHDSGDYLSRRDEVESIVIFADADLHELFANIESEVDNMINPLKLQSPKTTFL